MNAEPAARATDRVGLPLRRSAEIALAGVALVGLGLLVLASHVRHGGFYADDWANAAAYHFEGWWRFSVYEWHHTIPARPILAFLHPLPYALFGSDVTYHLTAAVVIAALTSLSFFAFLRLLGIELPHALAMALLSLVFPWADAAHLWPSGAMNDVAVIAYFLGSMAALKGLAARRDHPRRAVVLHGVAAGLYLVSILTYEVAAAAILASGLLYRTRASWRAVAPRWLLDAAIVVVTMAISLHVTAHVRHVGSLRERVEDIRPFVSAGLSLFASIFVPPGISSSWGGSWDVTSTAVGKFVVLAAAGAIVGVAVARSRRAHERDLRLWLYRGAAGACGVATAYVMFLGSGLVPFAYPGLNDRTNTFAAFGFVAAAYTLVVLVALIVGAGRSRRSAAVVAAGALLIGFGFIQRVRDDVGRYDAAAADQRYFLDRLHLALPHPPSGSTIYTFGVPGGSAPGVPIFSHPWDTRGAVDLEWNDRSLRAVPVYGRSVSCGQSRVSAGRFGAGSVTRYGRALFVDVPTGRVRRIRSSRACERARELFRPGPRLGDYSR